MYTVERRVSLLGEGEGGEGEDFIKIHEPCATCAPLSLVVFEFCALRTKKRAALHSAVSKAEGARSGWCR